MKTNQKYEIYHIYPDKDYYHQNWLFRRKNESGKIVVRDEYSHLKCISCNKIDELKALEISALKDVTFKLRGKGDFVYTHDFVICFSEKLVDAILQEGITGLDFRTFSNTNSYQIALPNLFVKTDLEIAKMQYGKKCEVCKRYDSVVIPPWSKSMELPNNELCIFSSEAWLEHPIGRMWHIYTSEKVVRILDKYNFSSVHFRKA